MGVKIWRGKSEKRANRFLAEKKLRTYTLFRGMSEIELISTPLSIAELKEIAARRFGDMVKAVVDIEQGIMAVGGELHADEEALLLDQGSKQQYLWGIDIYVNQPRESWIEFDSMINIRPSQNNRSRNVEDVEIQKRISAIVNSLIL